MKQGWEIKKLGDVIEIRNGKNQQAVLSETGKYKIMGSAGNVMGYSTDFICEAGTTIIGRKGNISKPIYIDERFWNVDTAFGFYPKNEDEIDKRLIYYLCLGIDFGSMNRGTTIPSLVKSELQTIQISYPKSLPEQQRIVAILDTAFAAIAKAKTNAEQNVKNAAALFESYLQGVFENSDWETKTLGEVVDFFNGFAFKSKDVIETSNTQLIRMGNLYQNQLSLERRAVFYPDDFAITYKKFLLKANDLIISLTGTTDKEDYGYTVKIPENEYNLLLNQRIAKISIKNETATNKDYLFHFLLSRTFLDKLYKTANGTRQANLSTETMKGLSIKIPNIKQQQIIVQKLDALSTETKKLEAIYQQKINDLEELKKSVLQKAFSGELKTAKELVL
jgi:type I restriction enzyme S subunit